MILGCIKIERDRILNILNGWMRSNIGKKKCSANGNNLDDVYHGVW